MPRLVKFQPQAIYGNAPFNMNLYTMAAVERHALRDTIQEYDPHVSLNDDPFQAALVDPNHYQGAMEMSFTSGLGAINPNALQLSPSTQAQLAQQNAYVYRSRAEAAKAMIPQTYDPVKRAKLAQAAQNFSNMAAQASGMSGDSFEDDLTDPAYWNQTMEMGPGLGVIQRPGIPPPPQAVKATVPEPIKTSTVYAVVGISVVAVLGSIAAWAYFSGKKK